MIGTSNFPYLNRLTGPIIYARERVGTAINGALALISGPVRKTANVALDWYITKFDHVDFFPRKLHGTLHLSFCFALVVLIKRTVCSIFCLENQILQYRSFETLPRALIEIGMWGNILVIFLHHLKYLRLTATENANLSKLKAVLSKSAKDLNAEEIEFFREQCLAAIGNVGLNNRLAKESEFHCNILRQLSFCTVYLTKVQDLEKVEGQLQSLYNQLQKPSSQLTQKRKLADIAPVYKFRYFENFEDYFNLIATEPYLKLLKNIISLSKQIIRLIVLKPTLIQDGSLIIQSPKKHLIYENQNKDLYLSCYATAVTACVQGHAGFKCGGQQKVKFSHLVAHDGPIIHDLVDHLSIFFSSDYYEIDFSSLITPLGKQILMRKLRQHCQSKKRENVSYVDLAKQMFSKILNNHVDKGHKNIGLSLFRWPQTYWNKQRKTTGDPAKISFEGNKRKMICSEWTAKSLVFCFYLLNLELHQKHLSSHQKNPHCCGIPVAELPQLVNFGYIKSPISPHRELAKILPYELASNPAFVHTRKHLGNLVDILED